MAYVRLNNDYCDAFESQNKRSAEINLFEKRQHPEQHEKNYNKLSIRQ